MPKIFDSVCKYCKTNYVGRGHTYCCMECYHKDHQKDFGVKDPDFATNTLSVDPKSEDCELTPNFFKEYMGVGTFVESEIIKKEDFKIVKSTKPEIPAPPKNKDKTESVVAKPTNNNEHWRNYFNLLEGLKTEHNELIPTLSEGKKNIASSVPVVVIFTSCWHIGSRGTEYTRLMNFIEMVLNTDNVYVGFLGDELDNFFSFYSQEAIAQQLLHPSIQRQVLKEIVDELTENNKLLFSIYSNHTNEREEKILGYSPSKELFKNTLFFDSKGTLDLTIGSESYKIFLLHKTKTNSMDNPCLGMKNELKRYSFYDRYDVVASAHLHHPYLAVEYIPEKTIFLKAGTFKTQDLYSERSWKKGIMGSPAVVFYPDKHYTIPFLDAEDALYYLQGAE